jgi:hypothetical protein
MLLCILYNSSSAQAARMSSYLTRDAAGRVNPAATRQRPRLALLPTPSRQPLLAPSRAASRAPKRPRHAQQPQFRSQKIRKLARAEHDARPSPRYPGSCQANLKGSGDPMPKTPEQAKPRRLRAAMKTPSKTVQDLADEFHSLIGYCIAEWAKVDEELFRICWSCLGTHRERASVVYYRTPTLGRAADPSR